MELKPIDYNAMLKEVTDQLVKGAFLTVGNSENVNTMTIGWGMVGFIWKKPIFQVLVRESRYTYELIEKSQDFTVTIPTDDSLDYALKICGSKSGRDVNKFELGKIKPMPSQIVTSPIIGAKGLHYECKIVAKQVLSSDQIIQDYDNAFYKNENYHTMYYGEIVKCYCIE